MTLVVSATAQNIITNGDFSSITSPNVGILASNTELGLFNNYTGMAADWLLDEDAVLDLKLDTSTGDYYAAIGLNTLTFTGSTLSQIFTINQAGSYDLGLTTFTTYVDPVLAAMTSGTSPSVIVNIKETASGMSIFGDSYVESMTDNAVTDKDYSVNFSNTGDFKISITWGGGDNEPPVYLSEVSLTPSVPEPSSTGFLAFFGILSLLRRRR